MRFLLFLQSNEHASCTSFFKFPHTEWEQHFKRDWSVAGAISDCYLLDKCAYYLIKYSDGCRLCQHTLNIEETWKLCWDWWWSYWECLMVRYSFYMWHLSFNTFLTCTKYLTSSSEMLKLHKYFHKVTICALWFILFN